MVTVRVITSDSKIWNKDQVLIELGHAMASGATIDIDLISEGPCFESLAITQLIKQLRQLYNYQKNITVLTCNLLQTHCDGFTFKITPPIHFVNNTKNKLNKLIEPKHITKTFGLFVGRSNAPRLDLASFVWKNFKHSTELTYHFDIELTYHRDNIGLDSIMQSNNTNDVTDAADFLTNCPLKFDSVEYPILMDQHCNITDLYKNFLVELVCETFYSGQTFFPTEKIWRPIAMQTPFVVQGPRYFLHKLKDLGFKTFDQWWDEGYAEDPAEWQLTEIKKVIEYIASMSMEQICQWYQEMTPILAHNRKRLLELTQQDLNSINKDF